MVDRGSFRRYARRCLPCEGGEEPGSPSPPVEEAEPAPDTALPGEVEGYLRTLSKNSRWRAKGLHARRFAGSSTAGFEFEVTADACQDLWRAQEGRCALSGEPLATDVGRGPEHKRARMWNASLDRIDSARNYSRDNVQLVCSAVNIMKSQLDMPDFTRFCRMVAARHPL
ncbi:hypothetical protein WJX74_001753 [Apatococcus lobatus]|uniref:Uncharacterized protein n=1 Tax=Apatococcus lobatus TaxID=904363 RepID=A0AAW1SFZ3_9CHLO